MGRLEIGEASVAVAVSTPHRGAAFEAGQWLIDTLKAVVPIWKKENWADGDSEWVHPGLEASPAHGDRLATRLMIGSKVLNSNASQAIPCHP